MSHPHRTLALITAMSCATSCFGATASQPLKVFILVGQSNYGGQHHFGPELQFGHVLGDYFDQPGAADQDGVGRQEPVSRLSSAIFRRPVGPYYTKMLADIARGAGEPEDRLPKLRRRGYELAGFVWYQGWNDGCEPKTAVPEYEQNLVNLIKDVRKDLNAPHLPVVIGELTGPWVQAPGEWATLRKAQAAAAARPEFQGTRALRRDARFRPQTRRFAESRPRPPRVRQRGDVFPGRRCARQGNGQAP